MFTRQRFNVALGEGGYILGRSNQILRARMLAFVFQFILVMPLLIYPTQLQPLIFQLIIDAHTYTIARNDCQLLKAHPQHIPHTILPHSFPKYPCLPLERYYYNTHPSHDLQYCRLISV